MKYPDKNQPQADEMDVPHVRVQRNETVKQDNETGARIADPLDHDIEKGLDRFFLSRRVRSHKIQEAETCQTGA